MHDMFPRLRDFIIPVALVIILSLVSMKLCPFSAPPVAINGIVVDVSQGEIHASQIIRGSLLNRLPYKISFDRETWAKRLPISCEELGANIVFVKGNDDIIVETMLLVQDYESRLCHDPYDEYILPWPRGE